MKKLMFILVCGGTLLFSCNNKGTEDSRTLKAENDSLRQVAARTQSELAETMSIINEVEENFNQIREAEKYLAIESNTTGELNKDTKSRINDNFQMINDILKKNRENITALNKRVKNSGGELSGLQKTIERLTNELEERAQMINELRESLAARDRQIADMTSNMIELSSSIENLSDQVIEQSGTIRQQDKELHSAYYIFGTSNELKEANVIKGGFLSSPKVLKESIDKSIFIHIDIRETKAIPVYAKKAKILSEHPQGSYSLDKDVNDQIVVNITDHNKFWSITRYLVIEVS